MVPTEFTGSEWVLRLGFNHIAPSLPLLSHPYCPAQQGKGTGQRVGPLGSTSIVTYYLLWPGA